MKNQIKYCIEKKMSDTLSSLLKIRHLRIKNIYKIWDVGDNPITDIKIIDKNTIKVWYWTSYGEVADEFQYKGRIVTRIQN